MNSLLIVFFFLLFLLLFWLLKKRKTKIKNLNKKFNQSKVLTKNLSHYEKSEFRNWLLKEMNVTQEDELPKGLKEAFVMDDWSKLSPDLYSKWSKYHWGI